MKTKAAVAWRTDSPEFSKYMTRLAFVVAGLFSQPVFAADLFVDLKPREMTTRVPLVADDTIGGYPIFRGGRVWMIVTARADRNNANIGIGSLHLNSPIAGEFFLDQSVVANLSRPSDPTSYYVGDPCSADKKNLVATRKAFSSNADNCLTINFGTVTIGPKVAPVLLVTIRNSQQGGRLYQIILRFNLGHMGFKDSSAADWTAEALAVNPAKKEILEVLERWAKRLQDAVDTAIGWNKPLDAFASVPSINTLLVQLLAVTKRPENPTAAEAAPKPAVSPTNPERGGGDTPTPGASREQRLSELKSLFDRGLISKEQMEEKRAEILKSL